MATQQSGLVSGNRQNTPGGNTPRNRSKFPLSYSQFQTERFAEYSPFFVEEGVSGDVLPLHSNHAVQTYTLKSPILQSLSKKSDFFVVPMQAILPLNWEKFYTNPNIGQDVPTDCGLGVENFWSKMSTLFNRSWSFVSGELANIPQTDAITLAELLKFLIFFENIYSCGSLMETLRISGHNWFRCDKADSTNPSQFISVTYDEMFDSFIGIIQQSLSTGEYISFTIGTNQYRISSSPLDVARSAVQDVTLREALELMRDDLSFSVTSLTDSTLISLLDSEAQRYSPSLLASDAPLNLGRLWAYQLVVSHFYSNDHVDFIYSAELYRQYIRQLVTGTVTTGQANPFFSVNGLDYIYDSLSAFYCNRLLSNFSVSLGIFGLITNAQYPSLNEVYAYFVSLFSFKRSLRFLDYFTGARAYPLAQITNGANLAPVSNSAVDVVDLSRSSMMTRFLQAVNRSGRKFSNYMRELFGKTPAYDYHNPMYLAHVSDLVGAQETDNTGQAQVTDKIAVTSRFRATSSRYAFEFRPDRDCIVIGITYYDLPRVYSRSTDAQNFYVNRFDMFNPYLQFIGDQGISEAEIGTDRPSVSLNFGYTNRNMEYKQRYNGCSGGFCVPSTQLDNWIFPADTLQRKFFHNIGPSFIRSFNSEIDRFYQRLSGYSLGTYYHFIVRYDNRQDASRPMAYNPIINV